MKDEKVKGYEWIGDAETTIEAPPNKHSEKYYEPNRDYDCLLYTSDAADE